MLSKVPYHFLVPGALLFNSLYTPLSHYLPGATYFVGSGLLLVPFVLVCIAYILSYRTPMVETRCEEGNEDRDQVHYNEGYQNEDGFSCDEKP